MSKDWYKDIQDFHKEVMLDSSPSVPCINKDKKELRISLITEETKELLEGLEKDDIVEIADGAADAIVVILGTVVSYGIDLRPIWNKVHEANILKKNGPMRSDGKRLKPEGWKHPDILKLLEEQRYETR